MIDVERERGDENLSAVLNFSALFLLIWVIFQVAVIFLGRNVALEAARDGVHAGRLPPVDTAAAAARAEEYTRRVTFGWLSNVGARGSRDGTTVTVTVTADAVSLVPFMRFPISQAASEPIEELS